jgi:hypothetical protein
MTRTAVALAAILALLFVAACVAAWLDDRRWQRELDADQWEPPSRLDELDGLDDWGGWKP